MIALVTAKSSRTLSLLLIALLLLASPTLAEEEAAKTAQDAAVSPAPAEAPAPAPPDALAAMPFMKDGKLDLDAAVKHFEDLYRADSSHSRAELTTTTPRRERTLAMEIWTKGEENALIVIQSPPREKGTATLKVDKNLWNYMPRIKRTVRIPPSMMLGSWMGSDFTNDDLVRDSSYKNDYTYQLVGRSEDPAGWLIRFDAKPDMVGLWKRFELIVSEDAQIPLQARNYDRKDQLARTIYWDDVKEFDGRRIPARMTLIPEDEDKEGHKTVMVYMDLDFDVKMPADTFSLSRLEQKR
jgi:Outer membrane lipoprotein-sorting protein